MQPFLHITNVSWMYVDSFNFKTDGAEMSATDTTNRCLCGTNSVRLPYVVSFIGWLIFKGTFFLVRIHLIKPQIYTKVK